MSALEKSQHLLQCSEIFLTPGQSRAQIDEVGKQALAVVYGAAPDTKLDFVRAS